MKRFDQLDPWELLGLAPGATAAEIRNAYERVSSRLAPGSLSFYSIADREEQSDLQRRLRAACAELLSTIGPEETTLAVRIPTASPLPSAEEAVEAAGVTPAEGPAADLPPAPAAEPEFGGEHLRRVRESRNLTLETLSHRTRIRRALLESLEAESFAALPERVFVRGFVFAVARELGLEPERVWASYGKRWEAWAAARS